MDIKKRKVDEIQFSVPISRANNGQADIKGVDENHASEKSGLPQKAPKLDNSFSFVPTSANETADASANQQSTPSIGFGFSSYAKINPFQAISNINGSKNAFKMPSLDSSSFNTEFKTGPPSLIIPSPKSPKVNPFSSQSPVHNPFVSIVESEQLWKNMASDKLSAAEALKTASNSSSSKASFFPSSRIKIPVSESLLEENKLKENGTSVEKYALHDSQEKSVDNENDEDINESEDTSKEFTDDHINKPLFHKIVSLPDNAVVVTGEENESCLIQFRVKLYRLVISKSLNGKGTSSQQNLEEKIIENNQKDDNNKLNKIDINHAEWVEVGTGPLKVLKRRYNNDKSINRIVMRREDKKGGIGTKLLFNVRLDRYVSTCKHSEKAIRIMCVNAAVENIEKSKIQSSEIKELITDSNGISSTISDKEENISNPLMKPESNGTVSNSFGTYLLKLKTAQETQELYRIVEDILQEVMVSQSDDTAP